MVINHNEKGKKRIDRISFLFTTVNAVKTRCLPPFVILIPFAEIIKRLR